MKITKISKTDEGCTCVECKKNLAQVTIILGNKTKNTGMQKINLCLDCVWTLGDAIDNTTAANFESCER